jgi:hypothetical protein
MGILWWLNTAVILRINRALKGGGGGSSEKAGGDKVRLYFLRLLLGFIGVAN